jgi:hypothetical protein
MVHVNEKANLTEMAVVSSRADDGLEDIDIAVFSNEHPPKHATILKRGDHKIFLGRFKITSNPPKTHLDIKDVKEEIDPKYKKQIAEWAGKKNTLMKGKFTNWETLNIVWGMLNLNK